MADLKLGLIGDNIAASQAPRLHGLAGRLCGLGLSYELLVPRELGLDFDAVLDRCRAEGFRGVNVTYPYKERVPGRSLVGDPRVALIGAANTLVFEPEGPRSFNTDCSGFAAAYRATRGRQPTGEVCLIGAGGVGRAIAFALLDLGTTGFRILDRESAKAEALAATLRGTGPRPRALVADSAADAVLGASGILNCTPLGMAGIGGCPLEEREFATADWAFDAVYTPADTRFLRLAADAGLALVSGYELFFHQGVHAFRIFARREVDEASLRAGLRRAAA